MSSDDTEGAGLTRRTVLKSMGATSAVATLPTTGAGAQRASSSAQVGDYRIEVLSSDPEQVSGGDALVEVVLPSGTGLDDVTVLRNGTDVTGQFSSHPDRDSVTGLLDGFEEGENTVALEDSGEIVLEEQVTNHPIHGPIFSGPQQQPFACNTADTDLDGLLDETLGEPEVDNQEGVGIPIHGDDGAVAGYSRYCQVEPSVYYLYRDQGGEYHQLDAGESVPGDVDTTTTTEGAEVPVVVRIETGVINRWVYTMSVLADPDDRSYDVDTPDTSVWNGRLLMRFQGGTGIGYTQGSPGDSHILTEPALDRGHAVAYSVGVKTGESYNLEVGGETALMLKEQFIERFGEPDFTYSFGASGGGVQSYVYAQNHPDLLDGIVPGAAFPDMITQAIHVGDCEPLEFYMDIKDVDNDKWFDDWNNREWLLGLNATNDIDHRFNEEFPIIGLPTQRPREGATECGQAWRGHVPRIFNPHWGAHRVDGIENYPDWEERFADVDLTHWDDAANVYGTNEHGHGRQQWDNVGVQYGLRALRDGNITKAEFLDVNSRVGGWQKIREFDPPGEPFYTVAEDGNPWITDPVEGDRDVWTDEPWATDLIAWDEWSAQNQTHSPDSGQTPAERTTGNLEGIQRAYESGFVNRGQIDIPIIDVRQWLEPVLDQHNSHQSFAARRRIRKATGDASNHLIWFAEGGGEIEDTLAGAFNVMDEWLETLAENPELTPHEAKPDDAVDTCFEADGSVIAAGEGVWDGATPDDDRPNGDCAERMPVYSQSRYQAGGPLTGDIFKCQLQPVEAAVESGLYGDIELTDEDIARLKQIFPHGVCDFDQPDAGEPHPSGLARGVWDSLAAGEETITGAELADAEAAHRAGTELDRLDRALTDAEFETLESWAEQHREGPVPDVPAAFAVSEFTLGDPGAETIDASATIENAGDLSGTKAVELRIDQQTVASEERTLASGDSERVTFGDIEATASLDPGLHTVAIATPDGEMAETLTIQDDSPSGEFAIESIDPESATVGPGETVTLTAEIRNTGTTSGTVRVELRVGDIPFESQELTIGAGETATATFADLEPAGPLDPGEYEPIIWTEDDQRPVALTITDGDDDDDDDDDDGETDDGGEFRIERVDPESATVGPGETLTLTTEITNVGEESGTVRVELRVGGIPFRTQELTIAAGETATATFADLEPADPLDPGEYEPIIWTEDDQRPVALTIVGDDDGGADDDTGGDGDGGDGPDTHDGTDGENQTDNESESGDGSGPGFGVGSAIATLGGIGYVLKRRLGDEEEPEG